MHVPLAFYPGFCADCATERPLVLVERGPRGFRAWLAGVGAEDRSLSYCCLVCGRTEHVPATEAEDEEYAATLVSWPDTFAVPLALQVPLTAPLIVAACARPVVRLLVVPAQRVCATDDLPLACAVA